MRIPIKNLKYNLALFSVLLLFFIFLGFKGTFFGGGSSHSRLFQTGDLSAEDADHLHSFFKEADAVRFAALIQKNPNFQNNLWSEIDDKGVWQRWSSEDFLYNARIWSLVSAVLQGQHRAVFTAGIQDLDIRKIEIQNYLDSFIEAQLDRGNGFVSNLDEDLQGVVLEAKKLSLSLAENHHESYLFSLAQWYRSEKASNSQSDFLRHALLRQAWNFSAKNQTLNLVIEKGLLTNDSDLIRLLNNEDENVALNAVNLITSFIPENSINALRFQFLRRQNKELRLALLDAMKSYGQHREQLESQLNNMMRLTKDAEVQEKIIETINHLNGRSLERELSFLIDFHLDVNKNNRDLA